MKTWAIAALACPACRGPLVAEGATRRDELVKGRLRCAACGTAFEVGPDGAAFTPDDGADRLPPGFDPAVEAFLPFHAGRLFAALYADVLAGALAETGFALRGATVLVGCCRGGADAEWLGARGARVLAADPSAAALGAAARRALLLGCAYEPVRAAPERLPLRDRAVDLSVLRDARTRLPDVAAAVTELARVTNRALIVLDTLYAPGAPDLAAPLAAAGWRVTVRRALDLAPLPPPARLAGVRRPAVARLGRLAARLARAWFDRRGRYGILVAFREP